MSKYFPVGHKVLVKPEPVEERSKGGILLPQDTIEKEGMAQIKAEVLAVGGNAFCEHNIDKGFVPWHGLTPEAGHRIVMAKYAGVVLKEDDEELRLINDEDVIAVIG